MTFAAPYMLWGLLGIIAPIIIHLWSKREQRVVRVGSIQFFDENESIKSRRIQLNELLLLLLRCLLIAAITLWLAGIRFSSTSNSAKTVYLVDPALASHQYITDSILTQDNVFWLQQGYPGVDDAEPTDASYNRWSMASGFESNRKDSVVIIASDSRSGYEEIRPTMPQNMTWISLDDEQSSSAEALYTMFYPASFNGPVSKPIKESGNATEPKEIAIYFPSQDTTVTTLSLIKLIDRLDNSIPEITLSFNENQGSFGIWSGDDAPPDSSIPWIWINKTTIFKPYFSDQNLIIPADATYMQLIEHNLHHKILNYITLNGSIKSDANDSRSMDMRMISPLTGSEYVSVKKAEATWWPILLIIGALLIAERFLAMKKQL